MCFEWTSPQVLLHYTQNISTAALFNLGVQCWKCNFLLVCHIVTFYNWYLRSVFPPCRVIGSLDIIANCFTDLLFVVHCSIAWLKLGPNYCWILLKNIIFSVGAESGISETQSTNCKNIFFLTKYNNNLEVVLTKLWDNELEKAVQCSSYGKVFTWWWPT
jgi:hypothetical protein